ncbi:NADH:ubiquinone reductase (Na(+)-transporting) subunit B [bacterium]|nr:NADH:ubiquinone reductase (Na(+)-transporting) subunit B [bacterium]
MWKSPKGKFHKIWPVFDAFDTFLFSVGHRTSRRPHVRDVTDLKRVMTLVIFALIPPSLFGIWNIGYQTRLAHDLPPDLIGSIIAGLFVFVPLVIISYGVGMTIEMLFCVWRKEEVSEGFLVTGLLIPLIVPPTIPWWQLALAVAFTVIMVKEVFGGTGYNIFNVALMARAFLFFAYPGRISGDSVWIKLQDATPLADGFTGATPLALGTASREMGVQATNAINAHYSFMDGFLGMIPGSIGETSKVAILIGAALLVYTGVASWKVIISAVAGLAGTVGLFNLLAGPDATGMLTMPIHYHLISGGFLFGVVYMATDPVTQPETQRGKWFFGFFIGVITALVRVVNPAYPEGTMLAILLLNVFAPLIDYVIVQINIKARRLRYAQ